MLTLRTFGVLLLLPIASWWTARQERRILARGVPLTAAQLADADAAGVQHAERIRLLRVASVPFAHRPLVRRGAVALRIMSPHISGLTARYGIFIRADRWDDRELLAHELAHTAQYERLGGIASFLRQYLRECSRDGYAFSPLEIDAAETSQRICANERALL